MALLKLVNDITNGNCSIGIFIDLLTYDTLNHKLLLRQMEHYELRGDALLCEQKKALRIICLSKWNAHTKPLFINHHILTLSNINKFQVCTKLEIIYFLHFLVTVFLI